MRITECFIKFNSRTKIIKAIRKKLQPFIMHLQTIKHAKIIKGTARKTLFLIQLELTHKENLRNINLI